MQLTGLQWRPAKINKLSDGSLEESVFGTGLSTDVTKGILHGRTEFFAVSLQTLQHLLHKLVPGLGDNGATSEALKKLATWATGLTKAAPCKNYNRTVPKALSHAQECELKLERHKLSSWTMMLAGAQRDAVVSRKRITHCVCEFNRKRKEHYANLRAVKEGVVKAVQVRCGGNDSTEEQKEFEVISLREYTTDLAVFHNQRAPDRIEAMQCSPSRVEAMQRSPSRIEAMQCSPSRIGAMQCSAPTRLV